MKGGSKQNRQSAIIEDVDGEVVEKRKICQKIADHYCLEKNGNA